VYSMLPVKWCTTHIVLCFCFVFLGLVTRQRKTNQKHNTICVGHNLTGNMEYTRQRKTS
jgi:hypothetical protein